MPKLRFIAFISALVVCSTSFSQTSWKGTTNTSWSTASNWTNGVPTSTVDAILGDANFTGTNQPKVSSSSTCKSLTVGGGTKSTTLTINKNLTVLGAVTINSNGTVTQGASTVSVTGNWLNNGAYSCSSNKSTVIFSGNTQSISGTTSSAFRKITINAGTTVTLSQNISTSGSQNKLTVSGILNPGESPTYLVTSSNIIINNGGLLHVKASTLSGNYSSTPSASTGSIVEYSSSTVAQTVSNSLNYSTLIISGSTTKTLAGNLPTILSSSSTVGNIYVNGGTFDLSSFTANRGTSVTGGNIVLASGTSLKIGGTGTFPTNFNNISLSLGSTVEYYGNAQTVRATTYGNLYLSATSGSITKTMPATAFSVLGSFRMSLGSGTSLGLTLLNNISVSGSFTIGSSCTYNASSFTTTVSGSLSNSGTITGGTGTFLFNGPGAVISGSGTNNFNNITITDANVSSSSSSLNISGNFGTTGSATFVHNTGGTVTFTGTTKTISGTGITFDNLTVNSGASVTSTATLTITGNITSNGTLVSSSGSATISGSSKTISGSGSVGLYLANITGSISSTVTVSVGSSLNVSGTYTATSGTTTFTGTSTLNGTANLFNVTINGTELRLATGANLGIAGTLTFTAGTLNVTASAPNTVTFNSTSSQSVNGITYDNLIIANASTKTASAAITINRDFSINTGATFNASSFTHTIYGNLNQNGTFTASTSTIVFSGPLKATTNGTATFNNLTINKNSGVVLELNNNITTASIAVNTGYVNTLTSSLTVTGSRTGTGIILGTVTHNHAFTSGIAYAFEGPYTTLTITGSNSISSISITSTKGTINGFPYGSAINRNLTISYSGALASSTATLRMQYEDVELNGNAESGIVLWNYSGGTWTVKGKSANDATNNYVEYSGLTSISNQWTLAENASVVAWIGGYDNNWFDSRNWGAVSGTPTIPPTSLEIVQLGSVATLNQPSISGSASVRSIQFYSTDEITLSLTPGSSLTTNNINGEWTQNMSHIIDVGDGTLSVNGDMTLGDNVANHNLHVNVNAGTIALSGTINQNEGCSLVFNGSGLMSIGEDFILSNGVVVPSTSTIKYNGSGSQIIAGLNYYNLVVDKTAGVAAGITSRCVIGNNIIVTNGQLDILATTVVQGDVLISSGGTLNGKSDSLYVAGNWTNNGTFIPSLGTTSFNGISTQTISASTFNNILIDKAAGTAALSGNIAISGNATINSGSVDLVGYNFNRIAVGGSFTMNALCNLYVSGTSNFPSNFTSISIDTTATVTYNGSGTQTVSGGFGYGNLVLTNGASNAKSLSATSTVKGNITINSGATFSTGANAIYLYGNWSNSGTFTPSTGSMIFAGSVKTITGATTFNKVTITGQYTVAGSNITLNDKFQVSSTGSYAAGSGTHIVNGDLLNSGSLSSTGTTTFSGTQTQTIQLLNAISSVSTGVINFNGTVAPVLNSNASPTYANLNINNTGGVTASVPWRIYGNLTIGSGATFDAGNFTDTITGSFTNNGTLLSSGIIHFNPSTNVTLALGTNKVTSTGTLRFGGSGQITITGTPTKVTNLTISNVNALGVTLPGGWTVEGNFSIRSTSTFNASSYTYNVLGNIESNGTLNGGTSTFVVQSATAEISTNSTTIFNNFTINSGAVLTINSDFNLSGNLVNNGTMDATSTGAPCLVGTGSSTISGSSTDMPQLIIAKTNATATLGMNLTTVGDLSIENGTLATSTFTIAQDGTNGGALTLHDYGVLKLEGTNGLPTFNSTLLDTLSTVEYAGTTQTVASANNYGNLTISATGTKTANGALNIVGNFTLTNGTFVGGSFTHNLQGNWLMTGGSYTNTGTTVALIGPYTQTVKTTGAFNNLTINKSQNTVYDSTDVTVNGVLTFTSGNINTGSYKVVLPSGSSVSRTSGYVIGTMQKYVATGSPTVAFEIGDVSGYTSASLVFSGVTVAGLLAANTSSGDHTDIANSQLNSAKSVNRKWTLANTGITFTSFGATFNFLSGDVDAGATTSNFYLSKYNGGTWFVPTIGTRTATSTQATGITTAGDFIIGELYARAWDGGASTSNWGDANNWNPDGVPGITEGAWIQSGVSPQITSAVTLENLKLNNASASVSLGSGGSLTINGELNLATGNVVVNSQTLTLNGTINASGTGTITGSSNAVLVIGGTSGGDFGTIKMTATSPNNRVKNFTLNRTGSAATVTIGSNGLEVTNLVTVSNGVLQAGGNLVLISDASGTARVAQLTSPADITGNVTVQRYIPAVTRRSRMISANTSSFDFNQIKDDIFVTGPSGATNGFDASTTNGNTIYTYQESTVGTRGWKGITNITNTLSAGKGALVFVRGDRTLSSPQWYTPPYVSQNQVTIDFIGPLNKGDISPSLTYTNTSNVTDDGWNLVGNPYASPISWSSLTKSNLSGFFYVFNPTTNAYEANSGSTNIASGQAFFVQATAANPSLTFTESSKASADFTGNFKTAINPLRIDVVKDSLNADVAWLNFNSASTKNYNSNEDALKFTNSVINLGFVSNDGLLVQYNSVPNVVATDTFMMSFSAPVGSYTMRLSNLSVLANGASLYLIDKAAQTIVNVSTTPVYNFSVSTLNGNATDRFMLVVNNGSPLPVYLIDFNAEKTKLGNRLTWQTASEMNSKGFYVERTLGASTNWETIGFVKSNNKSTTNNYLFMDDQHAATTSDVVYYRLKQVDLNERVSYSSTQVITNIIEDTKAAFSMLPNPATTAVEIDFDRDISGDEIELRLISNLGQTLLVQKPNMQDSTSKISLTNLDQLPTGVYIVEALVNGIKTTQKLVIQ